MQDWSYCCDPSSIRATSRSRTTLAVVPAPGPALPPLLEPLFVGLLVIADTLGCCMVAPPVADAPPCVGELMPAPLPLLPLPLDDEPELDPVWPVERWLASALGVAKGVWPNVPIPPESAAPPATPPPPARLLMPGVLPSPATLGPPVMLGPPINVPLFDKPCCPTLRMMLPNCSGSVRRPRVLMVSWNCCPAGTGCWPI